MTAQSIAHDAHRLIDYAATLDAHFHNVTGERDPGEQRRAYSNCFDAAARDIARKPTAHDVWEYITTYQGRWVAGEEPYAYALEARKRLTAAICQLDKEYIEANGLAHVSTRT